MDVQIFGTQKCQDTKKAVRFFKERRVNFHLVDLKKRAASKGELQRFAQKFGPDALIDRDGARYRDRGLHVAHVTDSRILPMLEDDPMLLRTPLVRRGKLLSIGHEPDQWEMMIADD